MGEVIAENDLGRHIRYRHRISSAHWSTDKKLWTLAATHTDDGETITFTANFLWMCQGYYRHAKGYTPDWPGMRDFKGRDRPPAVVARRYDPRRPERRRDRFGRDGRDPHSRDRE